MSTHAYSARHSAHAESPSRSRSTRLLLLCGIAAPLLVVGSFLLQDLTRPNFNPLFNWVSELSLSDQGWMMISTLIVSGLLMVGFAAGLRRALRGGKGALWGPILIAVCGIAMILAGVFVVDPNGAYPPGVPASRSLHGALHDIAGPLIFASLAAASFVLARRFVGDPAWRGWATYSIASGSLVIVFFIAASVLVALHFTGVYPGAPGGLMERLALLSGFAWIMRLALRLRRHIPPVETAR